MGLMSESGRVLCRGTRGYCLLGMKSLNASLQDRTVSLGVDYRSGYY